MDSVTSAATPLIGRDAETQAIDDLLEHVHERGGSLVVRGGSGGAADFIAGAARWSALRAGAAG